MFCDRLMADRWSRRRPDAVALVEVAGARAADGLSLTYAELWSSACKVAAALHARAGAGTGQSTELGHARGSLALVGPAGVDGVIAFLGAVAARWRPILLEPGNTAAAELAGRAGASLAVVQRAASAPAGIEALELAQLLDEGERAQAMAGVNGNEAAALGVHERAVDLVSADGLVVGHSHYSLVSGALSVAAFLSSDASERWLSAMPLWTWEGLYSVLIPLYLGTTGVIAGPEGMSERLAEAIDDYEVAYALAPYGALSDLSRGRPRRLADSIKRNLRGLLLSVDHPFPAGERRKARKALDVPILTVFGLTECGPILASHPSWYVDESVGIPVTNVEVQPANPQTGEPLDTNWELLDYASMVIRAPLVMAGYEDPAAADDRLTERLAEGWFETRARASFDANGMMYLVDE